VAVIFSLPHKQKVNGGVKQNLSTIQVDIFSTKYVYFAEVKTYLPFKKNLKLLFICLLLKKVTFFKRGSFYT
jgi:hypothetical protein